jgi:hypothetical protein
MAKPNLWQFKIWNVLFRNTHFISDTAGSQKKVLNSNQLKLVRGHYSLTKKILYKHLGSKPEEFRVKFLELQKSGFCAVYFINQCTKQGKVVPQESVRLLLAKFERIEGEIAAQNKKKGLLFNLTITWQERDWEEYFFH